MSGVARGEPTRERLTNPFVRYFLATRPAFLTITLAGCLLGMASASSDGVAFDGPLAAATLVLAMLAHAGINVLNDYFDHLNGSDARNTERLYPYTGGSRFIQNGVLTPAQTLGLAVALFALTIAGGLWLLSVVGTSLLWIGLTGLAIGWAYSAPPLRLNSRGVGEVCVALGFLLVVAGADAVQRGGTASLPWIAGAPYALLVASLLYINQFPDRDADLASGKLHWVARLDPAAASWGYGLLVLLSTLVLAVAVLRDALPNAALAALLALLPALVAWRTLHRFAGVPRKLAPAIRQTLLTAHAQPLLLAAILLLFAEH